MPTAQPCGILPMLQAASSGINARSGPGLSYEVLGQLQFLEVRPIVGRAQFATWWQINLPDGTLAWVSDTVANVSGYTGNVPTVAPPPLDNGETPTPGAEWEPTPRPICTPPPTATASATPSRTPTVTATSSVTPTAENTPDAGTGDEETATSSPAATASSTATSVPEEETPEAEPLPGDDTGGSNLPWLPIAGAGLIAVAVGLFIYRRSVR